ncbi:MAG: hypothetical protein OXH34_04985 [Bacteroidetes bacterium]|nr:hypothetical protein [Bacteroidota bacterium]
MNDLSKWMGMPLDASGHGVDIDIMMSWVHWLMLVLFLIWAPFFLYCLWRFNAKRHPRAIYTGVKSKISSYLEGGVVIAEAVLLVGFALPIWATIKNDFPEESESTIVNVIAEQFAWNVVYPGADGEFGLTTLTKPIQIDTSDPRGEDDVIITNTLHLVKDRPVIVNLSSRDVIHSFALPNMRVKQDAIPGLEIPVWFVPRMSTSEFRQQMAKEMPISDDERRRAQYPPYRWIAMRDYPDPADSTMLAEEGQRLSTRVLTRLYEGGITEVYASPEMEISCAQLCGGAHYSMRGTVIVHDTQEEFDAVLAESSF